MLIILPKSRMEVTLVSKRNAEVEAPRFPYAWHSHEDRAAGSPWLRRMWK